MRHLLSVLPEELDVMLAESRETSDDHEMELVRLMSARLISISYMIKARFLPDHFLLFTTSVDPVQSNMYLMRFPTS